MLSRESLRRAKHSLIVSSHSQRAISTAIAWVRASCATCTMLLILAATTVVLRAQTPTKAEQEQRAKCEAGVLSSGKSADAKSADAKPPEVQPPDNIADGAKAALACEWIDPENVHHVLAAFHKLTTAPLTASPTAVIQELEAGDPYPADKGFYAAAMGTPDARDLVSAQGFPDFVDTLAKANTLKMKAPDDEDALFDSTQKIIRIIFLTEAGKLSLVQINDCFQRKNNYIALRLLLEAYPASEVGYAQALERLRAAFAMNTDKLAKQVAGKITAAKN
jgi:hypothetical protein